jgi:hypothetical protein
VPLFANESQKTSLASDLQSLLHPDYEFVAHSGGMALLELEHRGQREALNGFMAGWSEFLSA